MVDKNSYANYEELPVILTIEDIMKALNIGKNSAYKIVKKGMIPSKKICGMYRITKKSFIEWLEMDINEES